jgi:hypothetical protein
VREITNRERKKEEEEKKKEDIIPIDLESNNIITSTHWK